MKNTFNRFTEQQREMANNIDLEHFLSVKGERLIDAGREKRLASNHSITISGNRWFDHAEQHGGYPVSFVKMHYGMDYAEAMNELLGNTNFVYQKYIPEQKVSKPFIAPEKNDRHNKVFAYLTKHRCINPSVLQFFLNRNLIYESKESFNGKEYNNAVFVGVDENGKPQHAHKRSIYSTGKRFVQNIEGSNPLHSFHFLGGSNRLYVFESPIDMLSFMSIYSDRNWHQHNYIALCGTSTLPVLYQLKNDEINHVVLCLDNDKAGLSASKKFEKILDEKGIAHSQILPTLKDFNEDLVDMINSPKFEMVMA